MLRSLNPDILRSKNATGLSLIAQVMIRFDVLSQVSNFKTRSRLGINSRDLHIVASNTPRSEGLPPRGESKRFFPVVILDTGFLMSISHENVAAV